MGKVRFTYDASKFMKVGDDIKQLALYYDLDCKIATTRRFFTETGTVVCQGSDENILKFIDELKHPPYNYSCLIGDMDSA